MSLLRRQVEKKKNEVAAKRSFSKTGFNENTRELLNNCDYEVVSVTTKNGEVIKTPQHPVKEFRKDVAKILTEHGVDKQEVTKVLDGTYQFPKLNGVHGFVSAAIVDYLEKGNKFNFVNSENLKASLVLDEVEKSTKEYKKFNSDDKVKVETGAHKKMKLSSKAPNHVKKHVK